MNDEIHIFGKKNPYIGLEDDLQISFTKFINTSDYRDIVNYAHIANERKTDTKTSKKGVKYSNSGKKLKDKGVSKGIPDCLFFNKSSIYVGLAIELKVRYQSGGFGTISSDQKDWLQRLHKQGWYCCVCYSLDTAMWVYDKYFSLQEGEVMFINKKQGK